jgi:hypothetical protein
LVAVGPFFVLDVGCACLLNYNISEVQNAAKSDATKVGVQQLFVVETIV